LEVIEEEAYGEVRSARVSEAEFARREVVSLGR
jgi:hypothetical protein